MTDPRQVSEPVADPWIEAVALAIREARRLHIERVLEREARRATLIVIDGSKRGETAR